MGRLRICLELYISTVADMRQPQAAVQQQQLMHWRDDILLPLLSRFANRSLLLSDADLPAAAAYRRLC